jgi:hypothetical protein
VLHCDTKTQWKGTLRRGGVGMPAQPVSRALQAVEDLWIGRARIGQVGHLDRLTVVRDHHLSEFDVGGGEVHARRG